MRQAGTISGERDAERFADHLLALGVRSRVEPTDHGWAVWVYDEDHVRQAVEELEQFNRDPADPRYAEAERAAAAARREVQVKEAQYRKNYVDVSRRWETTGRRPLTLFLVTASVLVTTFSNRGNLQEPLTQALLIAEVRPQGGGMIGWSPQLADIRAGEVWRLVTPMLIHFNVIHLLFNMLWLVSLGGVFESRRGSWRLLGFVLLAAVASNLAQYAHDGPLFGGMSGVVYGLFGYVWMKSRFDPGAGMYMHPQTVLILVGWFVICLTGIGPVANTAHGVGLAIGIVVGYAPIAWRKLPK